MKWLLIVTVVMSGCVMANEADVSDVSDFILLVDDYRYIESGTYQSGVLISGYGSINIITSGGINISGANTYTQTGAGEYWFILDASAMSIGDIGTIESTVIESDYFDYPKYKTYTLIIEVK